MAIQIINDNLFARFILAGVVNTIFGWLVFSFFIILNFNIPISLMLSTVIGTLFNYITFGGYAFKKVSVPIFFRFILSYIAVYILNLFLIHLVLLVYNTILLIQFCLLPPMALTSFFLMKKFVFR